MTIQRVNGASWGVGDKVTSTQFNALDINTTYALDKRLGQVDILESVVTASLPGRLIPSYAIGPDANTVYTVSSSASTIDVSTLTADRSYRFTNTSAQMGDRIFILNRSNYAITVQDNGGAEIIKLAGLNYANKGHSSWCELLYGVIGSGGGWVLGRSALEPYLQVATFTADGTYIAPPGVTRLLLVGWGGGGGGGGGAGGEVYTNRASSGGGGGGGACRSTRIVQVVPSQTYTVSIGQGGFGGVGGSAGANGTNGHDGGDTSFGLANPGSFAVFVGAAGGAGGLTSDTTLDTAALGGAPTRFVSVSSKGWITGYTDPDNDYKQLLTTTPGHGGCGVANSTGSGMPNGLPGCGTSEAAGGAGGANGTTSDGRGGGGGGGGGGGWQVNGNELGSGGSGGAGGAGVASGFAAGSGSDGASAAVSPNSGAGGGGGGGGGQNFGAGPSGYGGNGGPGSNGYLIVIPLR